MMKVGGSIPPTLTSNLGFYFFFTCNGLECTLGVTQSLNCVEQFMEKKRTGNLNNLVQRVEQK